MAKISTLVNDFSASTLDANWTLTGANTIYGGGLVTLSIDTPAQNNLQTTAIWDLTNSAIFAKVTWPAVGNGTHQCSMRVCITSATTTANEARFFRDNVSSISFIYSIASVGTTLATITYNATTMAWLRIRHSGSTVFWETSPDAVVWTTRASTTAISWDLTSVFTRFTAVRTGAESFTTMTVDNVNVLPATPFPGVVQDIKTEIELASVWTNITSYVRRDPGITTIRGRPDEGSTVSPSRCMMALDNRTGRFSPRNPTGVYFGSIGRNTPLRVSILSDRSHMPLSTDTGEAETQYATTPDAASLDLTTDFDVRFEADLDSWYDPMDLVGKWTSTGNQRSYVLYMIVGGFLALRTSVDGIASTVVVQATQTLPLWYGRQAVRVTFDANNGAAGNTATFYTASAIDGTWVQLGEPVITVGTTTVFASTSTLRVGPNPDSASPIGGSTIRGKIYGAEVRSSIGGTIVANPDFTIQNEAATAFADSTGKVWTLTATACTLRDYRFTGEVSAWPQRWDSTGTDIWTEIEASGILRRLGQGSAPVPSSIRRSITSDTAIKAYWPCEDGSTADRLGSAYPGGKAMTISGTPTLAADATWVASDALPTTNLASFSGVVTPYTATDSAQIRGYLSVPAVGIANGILLFTVTCSGTGRTWNLKYATGGTLSVDAYDADGTNILTSVGTAFAINGQPVYVALRLTDNGAGVDAQITVVYVAQGITSFSSSVHNVAAAQIGRVTKLTVNPEKRMDDVVVGHFSVSTDTSISTTSMRNAAIAWAGEGAGTRIKRLCGENDIPFFQISSVDETVDMGAQGIVSVLELLRECEASDMGILYEPRDQYGLEYRPRRSLNNQNAVVTTDYTASAMSTFQPTEDDQLLINDVTVTRAGGSTAREVDTASALSTSSPPDGVGIYDTSITLSLSTDEQLPDQASWRLHMGTVDEARYPVIGFDATSPSFLAVADLTWDLLSLDIGDRLVVTDSPAWLPPDDVSQLAQGFTEYLANFERRIDVNCSPASVWEIARYAFDTDDTMNQYKYSSDGTVTAEAMDTTETGMDVTTASGPVWTTDAAQLPFDIMVGGERMTVTAVSGTTANQTFTVTRSVNGVVKSHATAASVVLFRPARYSLT